MAAYNVLVQAQVVESAEAAVDPDPVQQEAEAKETDAVVDSEQVEGQTATDSTLDAESAAPTVRFYSTRSAASSNQQGSEKEQALAQWKSIPKREKVRDGLDYFTSDGYLFTPESVVEVYEIAFNAKHDTIAPTFLFQT